MQIGRRVVGLFRDGVALVGSIQMRGRLGLSLGLLFLNGCEGAMWGNLAVLAISLGIFMGTLSLGRS